MAEGELDLMASKPYVLDKGKSQQDNEKTILGPLLQISICWSSCHIGEL